MLHTADRWFFAGEPPAALVRWLTAGRALAPEPERADDYLSLPGSRTVGVKLRGGGLEVKALTAEPRPIAPHPDVRGLCDAWVKWSFADDGLRAMDEALRRSGDWTAVRKRRTLLRFRVDETAIEEVTASARREQGCNVELTAVEVGGEAWHTLGFEAFGDSRDTAAFLDVTAAEFFRHHGPPPGVALRETESLSYPAWLATRKERPPH